MRKTLGDNHPYVAENYNTLGNIHWDAGQHLEALKNLRQAFDAVN